jgi:hypothetical protein
MASHDGEEIDKKRYTTPKLMIHGTLKDITLLRFNWHGHREWDGDPIDNVS